jgi:hypothetical protein
MLSVFQRLPLKNPLRQADKDTTRRSPLASFRKDLEKLPHDGIPSLEEMESGKLVGAVLPMSEQAQTQMRNSIEVIDYLLNQERVVWS